MIKLLCIQTGPITREDVFNGGQVEHSGAGLINNQQYTATHMILNDNGMLCYKIKELNGAPRLAERLIEVAKMCLPDKLFKN